MAGPGLYYPSPPVFVGGRQPYAPAQPVATVTVATSAATPYLQLRFAQLQAITAWQPGPITIVWSGPAGATTAAPDPPVPLPAVSLGQVHLFPVLAMWQPVPLPLWRYLPRPPLPAPPLPVTAPTLNPGQLALFTVLHTWEALVSAQSVALILRARPTPVAPATGPVLVGGGRLIGQNRLTRG